MIFQGGWDGHEPGLVAERFGKMMEKHGYSCEISGSQDVLADQEKVMAMDLIIPCWTMGEIRPEYRKTSVLRLPREPVLQAVTEECVMPSARMWSGNL